MCIYTFHIYIFKYEMAHVAFCVKTITSTDTHTYTVHYALHYIYIYVMYICVCRCCCVNIKCHMYHSDPGNQSKLSLPESSLKATEAVRIWCCMFTSLQLSLPASSFAPSVQHETIARHHVLHLPLASCLPVSTSSNELYVCSCSSYPLFLEAALPPLIMLRAGPSFNLHKCTKMCVPNLCWAMQKQHIQIYTVDTVTAGSSIKCLTSGRLWCFK